MNINITLLYQMVFFAVFVWVSARYVWKPIMKVVDERRNVIAEGLAAASKGLEAEGVAVKKAEELVASAKEQASEIISRAERQQADIIEDAKLKAKAEGEKIVESARAEAAHEVGKAREVLRNRVGELAVAGAEKILMREVDESAHKSLINQLAQEL